MDHHLQDLKYLVLVTSKRIQRLHFPNQGEISKYVRHNFYITKGVIQVEFASVYHSENQNYEIDGLLRHFIQVSSSFHSLPLSGLSLFYTQTCSVIFSSLPVNLMFYSVNSLLLSCHAFCIQQFRQRRPLYLLLLLLVHDKWNPQDPIEGNFKALHFYFVLFPACTPSISHSSCCNLSKFVLQKLITFIFTPFAFTLVPITT